MERHYSGEEPGTSYVLTDIALINFDHDVKFSADKLEPSDILFKDELEYNLHNSAFDPQDEITIDETSWKLELGLDDIPYGNADDEGEQMNAESTDNEPSQEMLYPGSGELIAADRNQEISNTGFSSLELTDDEPSHKMLYQGSGELISADRNQEKSDAESSRLGHSRSPVIDSSKMAEGGQFKCKTCGKRYAVISYLISHMKVHSRANVLKCDKCINTFTDQSILSRHKVKHSFFSPHKCEKCNQTFRNHGELTRHMRIYSGAELHSCYICGKTFAFQYQLIQHTVLHSGLNPNKCGTCKVTFTDFSKLIRHMQIHNVFNLYECKICSVTFLQYFRLSQQMVFHSDSKPQK